jgi:hypothetical protein
MHRPDQRVNNASAGGLPTAHVAFQKRTVLPAGNQPAVIETPIPKTR